MVWWPFVAPATLLDSCKSNKRWQLDLCICPILGFPPGNTRRPAVQTLIENIQPIQGPIQGGCASLWPCLKQCFSLFSIGYYLRQLNIFLIEVCVDMSLINNSETFRTNGKRALIDLVRTTFMHWLSFLWWAGCRWHTTCDAEKERPMFCCFVQFVFIYVFVWFVYLLFVCICLFACDGLLMRPNF